MSYRGQTIEENIAVKELTRGEVLEIVRNAPREAWLYFEEEDVWSYRENLLIMLKGAVSASVPGWARCGIFYGAQQLGYILREGTIQEIQEGSLMSGMTLI